jgi:hypothetical protein
MRKILLVVIVVLSSSFLANAQFTKGSILLGGSISYSASNFTPAYQSGQESYYGNFGISAGKAIKENAIFGISLTYSPVWNGTQFEYGLGPLSYYNGVYGIGVFYRKYKSLGKEFYIFGEAGASFMGSDESGKDTSGIKLISGHTYGGTIYFMPGIAYKISKKVFLEITIPDLFTATYTASNTAVQSTIPSYYIKNNNFYIRTSLSSSLLGNLGIGFRLIL